MAEARALVVADTSVIINLNATHHAGEILNALPFSLAITEIVAGEIREDRRSGRKDIEILSELVAAKCIRIVKLDDPAQQIFAELIAGQAAETLDDGEAATIGFAVAHGIAPAIDERKARRIYAQRFAGLQSVSTVDLFAEAAVEVALGRAVLQEAVFAVLQGARMRVLPEHLAWVVKLIGVDRVSLCPSLPKAARRG